MRSEEDEMKKDKDKGKSVRVRKGRQRGSGRPYMACKGIRHPPGASYRGSRSLLCVESLREGVPAPSLKPTSLGINVWSATPEPNACCT